MKKIIIPLLLFFTITTNAQVFKVFGQDIGFVYVGPKIGGTFSTISNFSDMSGSKTQNRFAYQIGGIGEFGITDNISFQGEILFYSKGTRMDDQHSKIKMNYLSIPLLAKYAFKAFGLTKVYASAGVFNEIRTKGVEEYESVGPIPGSTVDLPSGFKKYDWGFSFGCGAEYPFDYGIFGLDVRYNLGMTDLTDSSLGNVNTKSRSFGFALTYKYDITKLLPKNRKKENK